MHDVVGMTKYGEAAADDVPWPELPATASVAKMEAPEPPASAGLAKAVPWTGELSSKAEMSSSLEGPAHCELSSPMNSLLLRHDEACQHCHKIAACHRLATQNPKSARAPRQKTVLLGL